MRGYLIPKSFLRTGVQLKAEMVPNMHKTLAGSCTQMAAFLDFLRHLLTGTRDLGNWHC